MSLMFHATSRAARESIEREGLDPRYAPCGRYVWLTSELQRALDFCAASANRDMDIWTVDAAGLQTQPDPHGTGEHYDDCFVVMERVSPERLSVRPYEGGGVPWWKKAA
jgi:hypothetical protein